MVSFVHVDNILYKHQASSVDIDNLCVVLLTIVKCFDIV